MSGDNINTLKLVKEKPLDISDLEYTAKLLQPFEDVVIERFTDVYDTPQSQPVIVVHKHGIGGWIAIALIIVLTFPKIREKSGLNEYILWFITTSLMTLSVIY